MMQNTVCTSASYEWLADAACCSNDARLSNAPGIVRVRLDGMNANVAQLLKEGIHFRALSQLSAIFTVHDRRG